MMVAPGRNQQTRRSSNPPETAGLVNPGRCGHDATRSADERFRIDTCASCTWLQAAMIRGEARKRMRRVQANETYIHPMYGALLCRVIKKDHERGREAETMCWPSTDEQLAVKMVVPSDKNAAKREAKRWAREKEAKVGAGVWMWWTDGSRSNDG